LRTLSAVLGTLFLSASVAGAVTAPVPVADIQSGAPPSKPTGAIDLEGVAIFAADDGVSGVELWRSDGTEAGTRRVRDILPGPPSSSPARLTKAGRTVFFTAANRAGARELWKTNGTAAGTLRLRAAGASVDALTAVGGVVYFKACDAATGCELWKSDGTEAGTTLVRDIRVGPASSNPQQLAALGKTLLFAADDGKSGTELWKSNGTRAGTVLVRDIDPAPVTGGKGTGHSSPADIVGAGDRVYFSAETAALGRELWTSDGTAAGTVLVKELSPGKAGTTFNGLATLDGRLFFGAVVTDPRGPARRAGLWRTDGRAGTTVELRAPNGAAVDARQLTVAGRTLFFAARSDRQLWKAEREDTVATPLEERSVGRGKLAGLFAAGSRLFFSAEDDATGRELWTSDGTPGSAALVGDIQAGNGSSNPVPLAASASTLFLSADDGAIGTELWSVSLQGSMRLDVDITSADEGWGVVHVTPSAPECRNDPGRPKSCSYDFAPGTTVTLSAVAPPDSLSRFTGWTGACTGLQDCTITLDGQQWVMATFTGPQVLDLHLFGTDQGWGVVEVNGGPMVPACMGVPGQPNHCQYRFTPGTEVTLSAFAPPDSMSIFAGWDEHPGSPCHGNGPCILRMDGPQLVGATFTGPQVLDLHLFGTDQGWGVVEVNGGPMVPACMGVPGQPNHCQYRFTPGAEVTLSAFAPPDSMSIFAGWDEHPGSPCHGIGPCTLRMDGPRLVGATFTGPQMLSLMLNSADGVGAGRVSLSAPMPPCFVQPGPTPICEYRLTPGTIVTLVPEPDPGSTFAGWEGPPGGPCVGTQSCTLTIAGPIQVGGTFRSATP
jgi:ELWxxDGT repeat protein